LGGGIREGTLKKPKKDGGKAKGRKSDHHCKQSTRKNRKGNQEKRDGKRGNESGENHSAVGKTLGDDWHPLNGRIQRGRKKGRGGEIKRLTRE